MNEKKGDLTNKLAQVSERKKEIDEKKTQVNQ